MTAALAGLGVTIAVLALAILFMGIRMSGLKSDAQDADNQRERAEEQLLTTAHELKSTIERDRAHFAALARTVEELEREIEKIAGPGDRRRMLERLLSTSADHPGNNGKAGLS